MIAPSREIIPFVPCDKCSHGFIQKSDPEGAMYFVKCSCREEYEKNLALRIRCAEANLIPSVEDSSFNILNDYRLIDYLGPDTPGNIRKLGLFAEKFETKYKGVNIYLYGPAGTQKTTVAKNIMMQVLRKGMTGYYVLASNLVTLLEKMQDFGHFKDDELLIKDILKKDLLIIDEFDDDHMVTYKSGWQKKVIFPFLKERLEITKKSVIFISNKSIQDMGSFFEGYIENLLQREVPDQTMEFLDEYAVYKEKVNLDDLWGE